MPRRKTTKQSNDLDLRNVSALRYREEDQFPRLRRPWTPEAEITPDDLALSITEDFSLKKVS